MSEKSDKVITRFAPSPTGALHVGGARTALFNWAYARKHGGEFILRVEDTDEARSSDDSMQGIVRDLSWLNIDWDHGPDPENPGRQVAPKGDATRGPYFQSQRLEFYHKYVAQLLASGHAYKCFKTADELVAMREKAMAEKKKCMYDPTDSRSLTQDQVLAMESEGRSFVVRFKMPGDAITVSDELLGDVTTAAGEVDDFVIVKAATKANYDGGTLPMPTFHFAVVVDDELMGVTHVIRGQEHLNNACKHVALQQALGFRVPAYAHIPLISNIDGSKMSKRDKAKAARQNFKEAIKQDAATLADAVTDGITEDDLLRFNKKKNDRLDIAEYLASFLSFDLPEIEVNDFRKSGYLSEVLCNYLALLGWNPGNDLEKFDQDYLAEHFDFDRVGKSASKFDRQKLKSFNADAIRQMDVPTFAAAMKTLSKAEMSEEIRLKLAEAYHQRSETLLDPERQGHFFFQNADQMTFDEAAIKKHMLKNDGQGFEILKALKSQLLQLSPRSGEACHKTMVAYAEANGLKLGPVSQTLRIALTGSTVSPPLDLTFDLVHLIHGEEESMKRIDRLIAHA